MVVDDYRNVTHTVAAVRFGYAFWKAGFYWDLEAARPSKPDWTSDPWSHKCNWKK